MPDCRTPGPAQSTFRPTTAGGWQPSGRWSLRVNPWTLPRAQAEGSNPRVGIRRSAHATHFAGTSGCAGVWGGSVLVRGTNAAACPQTPAICLRLCCSRARDRTPGDPRGTSRRHEGDMPRT